MIHEAEGVQTLAERIRDFAKQSTPPAAALKAILREAADEIDHFTTLNGEMRSILGVYYEATLPWEHLMGEGDSRSEWMRDVLPEIAIEIDADIIESAREAVKGIENE
jgi:hypothetical protein